MTPEELKDIQHRLENLEEGAQWLLVRQIRHEAKLLALIEEMTRALERAGQPTEHFEKRLRDLEGKTAREILREFGRAQEGGESPDPRR